MSMTDWWQKASQAILGIPGYVLDANQRLFGWYLFAALVLAAWVYVRTADRASLKGFARYAFQPRIWLHKSALLDYQLFVVNRVIRLLFLLPAMLSMVPIAIGLSELLSSITGKSVLFAQSNEAVVIAVFTLLLFLTDDFTRFLLHYALHKIPFLWDYHKVHHSALVLTPMTVYRSHPLENYLYACRMGVAQGIAVGLGYYLFGPKLSMYDVLGANVFIFAFNVMGSNLRHSHVWMPWGKRVENWLISPAMHQLHHSTDPRHFDVNMGTALAIWDRLFGTHLNANHNVKLRFGVGNDDPGHRNLASAYITPFKNNYQRLRTWLRR